MIVLVAGVVAALAAAFTLLRGHAWEVEYSEAIAAYSKRFGVPDVRPPALPTTGNQSSPDHVTRRLDRRVQDLIRKDHWPHASLLVGRSAFRICVRGCPCLPSDALNAWEPWHYGLLLRKSGLLTYRGARGGLVGGRHVDLVGRLRRLRRDIFRHGAFNEGPAFFGRQHAKPHTNDHAPHPRERPSGSLGGRFLSGLGGFAPGLP